jgi:pyruvate dehydrogenase complex dehydrogenase (E1) component
LPPGRSIFAPWYVKSRLRDFYITGPRRRQVRYEYENARAFGRILVELDRQAPDVAARVVTVSPDVASSTNLGGWINRSGIWSIGERIDWFADDSDTLVRWRESDHGRHVELGIAEVNLVGLLGELGATWSRDGRPLLPVGTIYDPFVMRAHEPWSFGIYAGGQSILVGTPSGITLGPEGGAHQSVVTPSVGMEQPGCVAWEPAFTQDFEWSFLHALSQLGREVQRTADAIPSMAVESRRRVTGDGHPAQWPDRPAAAVKRADCDRDRKSDGTIPRRDFGLHDPWRIEPPGWCLRD